MPFSRFYTPLCYGDGTVGRNFTEITLLWQWKKYDFRNGKFGSLKTRYKKKMYFQKNMYKLSGFVQRNYNVQCDSVFS